MGDKRMLVTWDSHQSTLLKGLQQLLFDEKFTDVTLVCENNSLKTHKVALVAMSSFFEDLFTSDFKNCCVVNMNISYHFLRDIITLMYLGEVTVLDNQLPEFFKVAEFLQVKGFIDSSVCNVSVNKKLVSDEKVNVEFIKTEHDHDTDLKGQVDNSDRIDDDSFIDPSTIVKQEIIEGDMPILFTDEDCQKPEETSKTIGIQKTHCNSVAITAISVKGSSKIQDKDSDDEAVADLLHRSFHHLDNQYKASDQLQRTNDSGTTTKKAPKKLRKKEQKKKFGCPANSISSRTRSQSSQSQQSKPSLHKIMSKTPNEKESRQVNRAKDILSVLRDKNSRVRAEQKKNGRKTNSPIESYNHVDLSEWFCEAKKNSSLKSEMRRSLSLFHEYNSPDEDNNLEGICPMHTFPPNHQEKNEVKSLVDYVYECEICHKKFENRDNYLMHLKAHYKNGSVFLCTCSSIKHKCKSKKMSKCSEQRSTELKQSYQPNIEKYLSRKTDQTAAVAVSPFPCNSCGRVFFHKKAFLLHLQTHKFFVCSYCGKQYTKLLYFKQHQKKHNK